MKKSKIAEKEAKLIASILKNAESAKELVHSWILHPKDYHKELETLGLYPAYCIVEKDTGCIAFGSNGITDKAYEIMVAEYIKSNTDEDDEDEYDFDEDDSVFITECVYCGQTSNVYINACNGYFYNDDDIESQYYLEKDDNIYDVLTHKLPLDN